MKRFFLVFLLSGLLTVPAAVHAQGAAVFVGYGFAKFRYRPANLDIARYNLDRGNNDPMRFPDRLDGFSFGSKTLFGENGAGEFLFSRRQVDGKGTVTDSLGSTSTYELRCRVSSFSFGGSFGVKNAQLGVSFDIGTMYIASRFNSEEWVQTFEKKRKLWFGHTFYASFMLPVADVLIFELRPYLQTSWFSVRMGSTQPLMAFRPSNFGVMAAIGFGRFDD